MTSLRPAADRGLGSLAVLLIFVGVAEAAQALAAVITALGMIDLNAASLDLLFHVARPFALVIAGGAILTKRSPLRALGIYWGIAAAHTLVFVGLSREEPLLDVFLLALHLVAWPVTLAIACRQAGIRAALARPFHEEGQAIQGLGVLMVLFGAGIIVAAPFWTMLLVELSSTLSTRGAVTLVCGFGLLVVTAVLELVAGRGLLVSAPLERVFLVARRAHRAAWVAAVATAFGMVWMFDQPGYLQQSPNPFTIIAVALALSFAVTIIVGPWAFLRVIEGRRTSTLATGNVDGNVPVDEDHGFSALGWVLLALGSTGLVAALGELAGLEAKTLSSFLHAVGNPYARVAVSGLALLAATDLIAMRPRFRITTAVYALTAIPVLGFGAYGVWSEMRQVLAAQGIRDESSVLVMGALCLGALALVVPVVSLVLVGWRRRAP